MDVVVEVVLLVKDFMYGFFNNVEDELYKVVEKYKVI